MMQAYRRYRKHDFATDRLPAFYDKVRCYLQSAARPVNPRVLGAMTHVVSSKGGNA